MGTGILGLLAITVAIVLLFGIARGAGSFFSIFGKDSGHAEFQCPKCDAICLARDTTCPSCGYEYR